jgi:hypothetical protein
LSYAVDAAEGLFFNHGVPVRFHEIDAGCCCQVETFGVSWLREIWRRSSPCTTASDGDENYSQSGFSVKIFQSLSSLWKGSFPVNPGVWDLAVIEHELDQIERVGPVRKHHAGKVLTG